MQNGWSILVRGIGIVLALTTLLAAGEAAFRTSPESIAAVATLASCCALAFLLLQHLHYGNLARVERYRETADSAAEEVQGFRMQVRALENDRRRLQQQVESLTADREISRAASQHTSFADFLDEIAGVVHDLAGARALSVFLTDEASTGPVPRAYYSLSRATELCLSISDAGGVMLMEAMEDDDDGAVDAELLRARRLNVTPRGAQVVVSGTLTFQSADIGLARLTLQHMDSEMVPAIETIEMLMAAELGRVRLDSTNVLEAMMHRQPIHYDAQKRLVDLACPLGVGEEQIGVVKVRFDCRADADDGARLLGERSRLLADSAKHIARAIRSERIYQQTIKDALTGLFNKRHMMTQLEGYFNVARRHRTHLSMILVDIDHFKSVNDTHGHLTGDMVLRDVGSILVDTVRSGDTPCRYGGEELAVILPEGSLQGSLELAERLRQRIEEWDFTTDKGEKLKVTASFGVAEFTADMRRLEDLIARADAALYESKTGGRNRVTAWTPPVDTDLTQKSERASRKAPARRRKTATIEKT